MARYGFSNGSAAAPAKTNMTTTYKTVANVSAVTATLRRAWISDVSFGTDGTPADNAMVWKLDRQTAAGTPVVATAVPLDPADAATNMVLGINHSAEPTVTAETILLEIGVNQRASYRWVAAPGSELVVPATNLAGIGLRAKSPAYASTVSGSIIYQE